MEKKLLLFLNFVLFLKFEIFKWPLFEARWSRNSVETMETYKKKVLN